LVVGTHILVNAKSPSIELLNDKQPFEDFILKTIDEFDLVQVGHVFHDFDGGGFTSVICLTESHLAIHTWPEFNYYTCDVYLCDYTRNNYELTVKLASAIKLYFKSYDIKEQIINR
jgi:S-adenosylmethionine decarboxylase